MRNPEDILAKAEGKVVPFTVDLPKDDAEFLEDYAAYRNKLADAELAELAEEKTEKKAKRGQTWTRKSLSEYLLKAQVQLLRDQLASMEKALGRIPRDASDEEVAAYAKRAHEWRKKKSA